MTEFDIAVFADGIVGEKTVYYLLKNHREHLKFIVLRNESSKILSLCSEFSFKENLVFFNSDLYLDSTIDKIKKFPIDYILLAWWPYIVKQPYLSIPKIGVLNFHPSYLPYNRGKHYNFWTIVEETPFGVSIHFVDESIDGGDIIFQKRIDKTWEDTGGTLYQKAQDAMFELFVESYPLIVSGKYERKKQNKDEGSFHYSKELDIASQIFLEKEYRAKDLINLLRARTFPPYPACYFFTENGEKYEVRINIKKVDA